MQSRIRLQGYGPPTHLLTAGASITLAKGLEDHETVGEGTSFSTSDGRIYAIVRVSNPARTESQIYVSFESADAPAPATTPAGTTPRGLALDIPAHPRWRTLARIGTNRPAGRYRCVVRSATGEELDAVEFTITE